MADAFCNRKTWIDEARGLAICSVVISHCGIDNMLKSLFPYFFVPIFFFLSGYLFKQSNQTYNKLSNRFFIRLGIPYVVFSILHYLVYFIVMRDSNYLHEMLIRIPTGRGLWFFGALMSVDVFVFVLSKIQNLMRYQIIPYLGIVISLVGVICVSEGEGCLWQMDVACCCLGYYYAGVLYKKHEPNLSFGMLFSVILFISYLGLSSVVFYRGLKQNVSINVYSMPILNYAISLLGCFVVSAFCKNNPLRGGGVLCYIGQNTVVVYGMNLFLILFIKKIITSFVPVSLLEEYNNSYMLVVFFGTLFIAFLMSLFINRYVPILVGNKQR